MRRAEKEKGAWRTAHGARQKQAGIWLKVNGRRFKVLERIVAGLELGIGCKTGRVIQIK
jgi:hypothetical protein